MTTTNGPMASLSGQGVHPLTDEIKAKLAKKKISPSLVTGLEECPAKWFSNSFIIRDIIEQEPDSPGRRGNMFHKVMEDFFALPAEERTLDAIRKIVEETLVHPDFADLGQIPEAVTWLKEAVNGYYRMEGNPQGTEIAQLPTDKGLKPGLELFVSGKVGNSKRDSLGFIDRVRVDPEDPEAVIVEDWKTGKVKRWNPDTDSKEGFAELRQQIIYTEILEGQGIKVSGARLMFPVGQEIVDVPIHEQKLREQVRDDVEEADEKLDLMIERNEFPYSPSYLCAWCPLAKICPQAQIKPYKKMQDAYADQPSMRVLSKGFEIT